MGWGVSLNLLYWGHRIAAVHVYRSLRHKFAGKKSAVLTLCFFFGVVQLKTLEKPRKNSIPIFSSLHRSSSPNKIGGLYMQLDVFLCRFICQESEIGGAQRAGVNVKTVGPSIYVSQYIHDRCMFFSKKDMMRFHGRWHLSQWCCSSNTSAIIPVCKKLGSPPFISHEVAIWKGSHNTMVTNHLHHPEDDL